MSGKYVGTNTQSFFIEVYISAHGDIVKSTLRSSGKTLEIICFNSVVLPLFEDATIAKLQALMAFLGSLS